VLKVSLDGFVAHEKLVCNLLGFDPSFRKVADPEFRGRQRVWIKM